MKSNTYDVAALSRAAESHKARDRRPQLRRRFLNLSDERLLVIVRDFLRRLEFSNGILRVNRALPFSDFPVPWRGLVRFARSRLACDRIARDLILYSADPLRAGTVILLLEPSNEARRAGQRIVTNKVAEAFYIADGGNRPPDFPHSELGSCSAVSCETTLPAVASSSALWSSCFTWRSWMTSSHAACSGNASISHSLPNGIFLSGRFPAPIYHPRVCSISFGSSLETSMPRMASPNSSEHSAMTDGSL